MASSTWRHLQPGLWTHGLTQLAFAFLLWALLRDPASWNYGFRVGLALAVATANRPPNVLMAVALLIYFVCHQRHQILAFCTPLFIVGLGVLAYNLFFFGSVLGASPDAIRTSGALDIFLQGSAGEGDCWAAAESQQRLVGVHAVDSFCAVGRGAALQTA